MHVVHRQDDLTVIHDDVGGDEHIRMTNARSKARLRLEHRDVFVVRRAQHVPSNALQRNQTRKATVGKSVSAAPRF